MEHSTKIDCKYVCLDYQTHISLLFEGADRVRELRMFRAFLRIRNQQRSPVAPEMMLFNPVMF